MSDCLFCRIIQKEIPAKTVYEDQDTLVFEDIHPQAPVHCLVIPKKHIPSVNSLTEEDGVLLAKVMQTARKTAMDKGIDKSGYRLVINTNAQAGQTVFHLHVHLLGGRNMNWPPG